MSNKNNEDNATRNLLPLEPKEKKYSSDKIGKFKVQTDPADNNSVKYDFSINHVEGSEDLRELMQERVAIIIPEYVSFCTKPRSYRFSIEQK